MIHQARSWRRDILFYFILLVLIGSVHFEYINVNDFWQADDRAVFVENHYLTKGDWSALVQLITGIQWREWSPVGWAFLFFVSKTLGVSPLVLSVLNIFLHSFNAFLILMIIRRAYLYPPFVGKFLDFSTLVALLFALHPVNVELVAIASGVFWLLSCFLGLGSIWFFLLYLDPKHRSGTRRYYYMSLSLLLSALLVKSSGLIVALLLIALVLLIPGSVHDWRRSLFPLSGHLLLALSYGLSHLLFFFEAIPSPGYIGGSLFTSILSHIPLFFSGIENILLPLKWDTDANALRINLSYYYGFIIIKDIYELAVSMAKHLPLLGLLFLVFVTVKPARVLFLIYLLSQALFMGVSSQQFWHSADRYHYLGIAAIISIGVICVLRIFAWASLATGKVSWISSGLRRGPILIFFAILFLSLQVSYVYSGIVRNAAASMGATYHHTSSPDAFLFKHGLNQIVPYTFTADLWTGPALDSSIVNKKEALRELLGMDGARYMHSQYYYYEALLALAILQKEGIIDHTTDLSFDLFVLSRGESLLGNLHYYRYLCYAGGDEQMVFYQKWKEDNRTRYGDLINYVRSRSLDSLLDDNGARSLLQERGNYIVSNFILANYNGFIECESRFLLRKNKVNEVLLLQKLGYALFPHLREIYKGRISALSRGSQSKTSEPGIVL